MIRKVLLIDDADETLGLVRKLLELDGIEVFGARDGTSGIAAARELGPDLILLDIKLPGMDGFEVCELLAIQCETAQTPIVFLSGSVRVEDRVRGLCQGATDFIVKPFDPDEFRARVRVALRYKALLEIESRRALRDCMTGLWNRLFFDERLKAESAATTRHGRSMACLMLDLDHFKSINDTHGHAAGDEAIRAVGALLTLGCRTEDVVCRFGGEEFIVLCPSTTAKAAHVLAERLRKSVAQLKIQTASGPLKITCSIGIADGLVEQELVRAADQALYQAKRAGRNRVCLFVAPAAAQAA